MVTHARFGQLAIAVLTVVHTSACAVPDDASISEQESAISVGTGVSTSCSTAVVLGLAKQIAREVACISPKDTLASFKPGDGVRFTSSAVLPFLNAGAEADLHRAAASGGRLRVNSGYRTVVQQYLLYRWWREGRCGIAVAAPPGTSNHEGARAVDLANWSSRVGAMHAHHWAHDVPGDPVHFDHLSSPDIRGRDVRAFQRLWNRNHPDDKIATDGLYGRQTAARLKRAPARGFAKGPTCDVQRELADVVAVDGPDRVLTGARAHYEVSLANGDTSDWPADAHVVIADGTPSPLYDPATWTSPTDLGPLGSAIAAGGVGVFAFDVTAPAMTDETPVALPLAIAVNGQPVATFDLATTVALTDADTSADTGDSNDSPDVQADEDGVVEDSGGCAAGGGGGSGLALAGALALMFAGAGRRRRR